MTYQKLVSDSKSSFEKIGKLKLARDLTMILDNDLFKISLKDNGYGSYSLVENRQKAFDLFCALCLKAGVDLPVLESELYRYHLPKDGEDERTKESKERMFQVVEHLKSQLRDDRSQEAEMVLALGVSLTVFPRECGAKQVLAVINETLVAKGLDPVRPDYSLIDLEGTGLPTPKKMTRVLVVDDEKGEICKTLLSLVGLENVQLDFFHFQGGDGWSEPTEEEKQEKVDETVKAVLELNPDIILLDKSMGDIDGPGLVGPLRRGKQSLCILGNTGGGTSEFERVGVYTNCEKGRNNRPVRDALIQR